MNLVPPSRVTFLLRIGRSILCSLFYQIFTPSDSSAILNLGIWFVIIAEFKTTAVNVLTPTIPIQFALAWRTLVRHWHVGLTLYPTAHWTDILHLGVGIGAAILSPTAFHVHRG